MNEVRVQDWTLEQVEALQTALGRYREVLQTQQARSETIEQLARAARRAAEVYRAELNGAGQPNDPVLSALEQTARQRESEKLALRQGIDATAAEVNRLIMERLGTLAFPLESRLIPTESRGPLSSEPPAVPVPPFSAPIETVPDRPEPVVTLPTEPAVVVPAEPEFSPEESESPELNFMLSEPALEPESELPADDGPFVPNDDPGEDVDALWASVIRSSNAAPFGEG